MAVQWVRGTTAQNDAYTGPVGSFSIDTEAWSLRIHDGLTAGGHIISQDAETLSGFEAATDPTASTVVVRDANGDVKGNLFRSYYTGSTSPSVSANFFLTMVETGSGDNYLRPTSVDAARNRISQFTAMPTVGGDAIVSQGSNANGSWVRYSDGTQICWNKDIPITLSTSERVAVGGATLPANFIDENYTITANPEGGGSAFSASGDRDISISPRVSSNAFIEAVCWKNSAATFGGNSGKWQYTAIGRWK